MTVRPVNGFLTSSGKYFDREVDAKAYDASYFFHKRLHTFLDEKGLEGLVKDFALDAIKDFVLMHKEEVMDYMALTNDKPRPEKLDQRGVTMTDALRTRYTEPAEPQAEYKLVERRFDTGPVLEPVSYEELMEGIDMIPDNIQDLEITGDGFVQAFDGSGMGEPDAVPEET